MRAPTGARRDTRSRRALCLSGVATTQPVAATTATIPLRGSVRAEINWGDGSKTKVVSPVTELPSHTYKKSGNHTIKVTRAVEWFGQDLALTPTTTCITKVINWATLGLKSLSGAFLDNTIVQKVAPPPRNVINLSAMFAGASAFNAPVSSWKTKHVTDMSYMVYNATAFNQPLGAWNTARVQATNYMFAGATSFNQPLNTWNTGYLGNTSFMFSGATNFNQPLDAWNANNLVNTPAMFQGDTSFNQPLNTWNTQRITDMSFMFAGATSFNQPLASWNLSSAIDMMYMFYNTTAFDQSLATWDVENIQNLSGFLTGTSISSTNYGNTLTAWAAHTERSGVHLDADSATYPPSAAAAHNALARTYTWVINDAVQSS